jgi:UPF0755 protein
MGISEKSRIYLLRIVIVTVILVIFFGIGYGIGYWSKYKKSNVKEDAVVKVYKHYTYSQFLDTLENKGIMKNWKRFESAADSRELEKYLKPGRYEFKKGMSNQEVIRIVANGWQTPMKMTFKGYVRKLDKLAYAFSCWFEADSASFAKVLNDKKIMDSLGFKPETFISMFIPNTYEFYWTASPENVVMRFKKEYDRFWNEDRLAKAKAMKFTPVQVSTLASIVAEETNAPGEWPKIAGVYMNRIKKGIPLQACPTVKYVFIETEPNMTRILNRHLKVDSPYNTYKHRGLPPGPITIAPAAVLDAVLNYEKTDYLYFCAKPEFDGTHNFAKTYSQHMKHSAQYNKAYKAWLKRKNGSQ